MMVIQCLLQSWCTPLSLLAARIVLIFFPPQGSGEIFRGELNLTVHFLSKLVHLCGVGQVQHTLFMLQIWAMHCNLQRALSQIHAITQHTGVAVGYTEPETYCHFAVDGFVCWIACF